jgi:hypothetical protein
VTTATNLLLLPLDITISPLVVTLAIEPTLPIQIRVVIFTRTVEY